MTGNCCVFKFLERNVDGKHLMNLQNETGSVFKFFRRNVEVPNGYKSALPSTAITTSHCVGCNFQAQRHSSVEFTIFGMGC